MNSIDQVNKSLAKGIALLNVVAAGVVVLVAAAVGYMGFGFLGLIAGVLLGVAVATVLCGVLALLINIRDLLAESLAARG